ncbi:signal peptidase I [Bacillus changyiensis]|uniref:signal peptidase I n=1 Tax=Bacillus changyiensis TaxID=3004103 RepID=UPI0022E7E8D6|nr:signal peptidase I [Bacillus changyiensis]MDA1475717.1 signal peptidase I [Bacillus changyiensis]
MTEQKSAKKKSSLFEWVKAIIIAIVLAIVIRIFLFEPYLVEGTSMDPTLHDGERLFVYKTVKYIGEFNRGDIVIIDGDEKNVHYVKRLIGLPHETVQVKNDTLYINGKKVAEPYLSEKRKEVDGILTHDFGPVKVPEGKYFVMGDNRQRSMDSRNGLGMIDKDRVAGTSQFVFFPLNEIRKTD